MKLYSSPTLIYYTLADGRNVPVSPVSVPGGAEGIIEYTPVWGYYTGTKVTGAEVVLIETGSPACYRVMEVHPPSGPRKGSTIPANGFVLSAVPGRTTDRDEWLLAHFRVGDWVTRHERTPAEADLRGNDGGTSRPAAEQGLNRAEDSIRTAEASLDLAREEYANVPFREADSRLSSARERREQARRLAAASPAESVHCSRQAEAWALEGYCLSLPSRTAEARGVWYRPVERNAEEVGVTLDRMAASGLNELYLETFFQGYTIFPSRTACAHGIAGQNPVFAGWDPLDVFVKEAAKRGIAVHAWINGFMVGIDPSGGPILRIHPEWAAVPRDSVGRDQPAPDPSTGYFWMDIVNPEPRDYLIGLMKEMVGRYGAAGVNLDYMRFPSDGFSYSPYARSAYAEETGTDPYYLRTDNDPAGWEHWTAWLHQAENEGMKAVYRELKALAPQTVVSAAPEPGPEADRIGEWAEYVDVVIPQAYYAEAGRARESVIKHKEKLAEGCLVYSGLYPLYIHLDAFSTVTQLLAVRDLDQGASLFSFGQAGPPHVKALRQGPWRENAVSPGLHPIEAASRLISEMVRDLREVYLPRGAAADRIGGALLAAMEAFTAEYDSLREASFGPVMAPDAHDRLLGCLGGVHRAVASGKAEGGLHTAAERRLQDQLRYAEDLITYSRKKGIW
ncbi:family 10 glycosylhydrolase [Paenibacillus sp. CC-CFT747]|nr:family 10 glycosylhydrolase [Paenibacillus sp. CC-CFT747]